MINGSPATGARVRLMPVARLDSRGSIPSGVVQEDGEFRLTTYELGDGAPAGQYKLVFEWPQTTGITPGNPPRDRLKGAYSQPEQSQWAVSVDDGPLQIGSIHLSDVKIDSSREQLPAN